MIGDSIGSSHMINGPQSVGSHLELTIFSQVSMIKMSKIKSFRSSRSKNPQLSSAKAAKVQIVP